MKQQTLWLDSCPLTFLAHLLSQHIPKLCPAKEKGITTASCWQHPIFAPGTLALEQPRSNVQKPKTGFKDGNESGNVPVLTAAPDFLSFCPSGTGENP